MANLFSNLIKSKRAKKFDVYKEDILWNVNKFEQVGKNAILNANDKEQIRRDFKETYDLLIRLRLNDKFESYEQLHRFVENYRNLESFVEESNRNYYEYLKSCSWDLLSNIDNKSLDNQQRDVVVNQNDRCLVVAGAGSGKTLTVSGKVKYLCEVEKLDPKDILLISFTRKASEEMTERIRGKLGLDVQATTFHKLGLDILKKSTGKTYNVMENMKPFMDDYFSNKIIDNNRVLGNLMNYFAYYLQIPGDFDKSGSLGEFYEKERTADLETVKSKYTAATFSKKVMNRNNPNRLTIKNEKVKSLEEALIANYLFLHGVEYEYERVYPFQDENSPRRVYKPDFYLPEYDIYIEHFGINKEGRCPQLSRIEEEKYLDDRNWKIEAHNRNGTQLIQTFSYYQSEGILESKLEEELLACGVVFKDVNLAEIFKATYVNKEEKYFSEFMSLCQTFISLFKSNGFEISDLYSLEYKSSRFDSCFYRNKKDCFLSIIEDLLFSYENYLKENNAYDFSDMINLSKKTVDNGFIVHPYKYIIIDEFQDISVARFNLIESILNQTGAKLLCVGDDWQSIYRFAGSDISLFTEFNKFYKDSQLLRIEKTYRNSQQLITETGKFVMANPNQIKKDLKSSKYLDKPLVFNLYSKDNKVNILKKTIDSIIDEFGKDKTILLLGRTTFDFDIVKESGLFYGKTSSNLHYKNSPETPVSFMTVHKSKGLEADNVVLLNFENSTLGFPNKIADDPLLELVLSSTDGYEFGEERRLLYVALTRTKNKTYVLVPHDDPSIFYDELKDGFNVLCHGEMPDKADMPKCPKCMTGNLVKRISKNGKEFIGCTNYPKCDYTVNSVRAVENQNICPACGGYLQLKIGKRGAFFGCTNYPQCNYTEEPDTKTCPKCGGELRIRKGKYGFFYGCRNYPACDYKEKCNE